MKRITIKVGTNILTTEDGKLDLNQLRSLATQIATLKEQYNSEVVLVSSGSITCGSERLDIKANTIPEKQASAAVGQFLLMKEYDTYFSQQNTQVAQILLTRDGLEDAERRRNVTNTLSTLLSQGAVPIINENDSVSTAEIEFGDNDELSSHVAVLTESDLFIMLTDTQGLYNKNPKQHDDAVLIEHVPSITDEIIAMTDAETGDRSKGGMLSKVKAARRATEAGIPAVIAHGRTENIIIDIASGKHRGTRFEAKEK
jgi:glutamate 5-kinase